MKKTVSIADRKEAIRTACMLAEKGDVILVAAGIIQQKSILNRLQRIILRKN